MKHTFTSRAPRIETYSFRIKTSQKNAVLFYAKGPSGGEDFTLIEIKSSYIWIKVNFGSDGRTGMLFSLALFAENLVEKECRVFKKKFLTARF